jgi:hypothetical protein
VQSGLVWHTQYTVFRGEDRDRYRGVAVPLIEEPVRVAPGRFSFTPVLPPVYQTGPAHQLVFTAWGTGAMRDFTDA